MFIPDQKKFLKNAKKANMIPVYKEIVADMETPVSAYVKLDKGAYSYLLDSVEGGERLGRYSFLGINPSLVFSSSGKKIIIIRGKKRITFTTVHDPLYEIKKLMSEFKFSGDYDIPRFFGGFVGYIGYDMVRFFEDIPQKNPDELSLPDSYLILADELLIFDHINHTIKIVVNAYIKGSPIIAYKKALRRIDDIIRTLKKPANILPFSAGDLSDELLTGIKSNMTEREFIRAVRKAKEYIKNGDIIQVVLSQRFRMKVTSKPFDIYRALRSVNPSPYLFYLKYGALKLIGSSPEILVRCENRTIQVRPIAGTRPRGKDEKEDLKLERELLKSPKEKAEHIMLVDLGRNDIGRVSQAGSVKVSELMVVEKYSHVMHIVSECVGKLKTNLDQYDVMRATFPAGTVTGAPKVRAMEIIDELENVKRGPYAGCICYFSFTGNLDSCITLRTIIVKDNTAYIQAGAGLVADSNPKKEYEETQNKAKALLKAIKLAQSNIKQ
ncbi:MAG: anthranilate synthase component I [Candidatus Omnitrophota bacterium]